MIKKTNALVLTLTVGFIGFQIGTFFTQPRPKPKEQVSYYVVVSQKSADGVVEHLTGVIFHSYLIGTNFQSIVDLRDLVCKKEGWSTNNAMVLSINKL